MSNYAPNSVGQEPFYFQIVPRSIISRTFEKQQGQFRFHVYKTTQRVDFTKEPFLANFQQNKMKVVNARLNFFLPNYYAGKNNNAKFIFELSKKSKFYDERSVGSYIVDPNIYIQEFKRNQQKNHYSELWPLSDQYSVEVELFFDESKYLLEKVLRLYRDSPPSDFNKPMISKVLEQAKKVQVDEDKEYDNEDRYNQKRLQLFNKYAGAIVGTGGYRIFDEEQQKSVKKVNTAASKQESAKKGETSLNSSKKQEDFKTPIKSSQNKKAEEPQKTKQTQSATVQDEFSQNPQTQIKNLKFLIIGIVILILMGSGYFLAKIFLKEETQSVEIPTVPKSKKTSSNSNKKTKSKTSKKAKNALQL